MNIVSNQLTERRVVGRDVVACHELLSSTRSKTQTPGVFV